ncbi:MAG: OmpA family protein [Sneathiella sp.]
MVNMQISSSLDTEIVKKGVSRTALLISLLVLAGCSSPDWVNPGTWFEGEGDASRPEQIEQPEYPKLGDVPDEAGKTVSIQEAKGIEEGLKADRDNAQYTDEQLRADTSPQAAPRPKAPVAAPAPTPVQPAGPAVAAAPSPAVNSAAIPQPGQATTQAAPATGKAADVKLMPNAAPTTTPQQAYARVAPGTGTTVISGNGVNTVFQQQLAASAATTTTLPANTQFQSYPVRPLGTTAVTVAPIVRDTYNQPVALGYGASVGGNQPVRGPYNGAVASGAKPDAVIHFEVGSARIGAGDRSKLVQIANLQKQSGATLRVVGHASSRTRELPVDRHMLVNLRMSQERSSAVVTSLINMGVDARNIIVESVSDKAPVTRESMPSAEAKNRRTEIFLVK